MDFSTFYKRPLTWSRAHEILAISVAKLKSVYIVLACFASSAKCDPFLNGLNSIHVLDRQGDAIVPSPSSHRLMVLRVGI